MPGALAEWLRSGLQSRLHRFDSGRRLRSIKRTQIRTLLAKGKSLAEIAETLNRKDVPPAHGTNRWTAAMVRKAYVS